MEKKLLSLDETAQYLGVKKPTLYSWVFQRKIPYLKVGRLVKFDLHKLTQWLEQRSVPAN